MKIKKILMSVLLAMGFIAAKAATGYPPELILVSQPVMVYNYNSITVYYDVQNIGDYAYRGNIYIYLDPDNGYYYANKYVKVCPGRIKRVAIKIPAYRPNPANIYTIMPYYELGGELYSFTTFEYFEPLRFHWDGPRREPWVVVTVPVRPRRYIRPGTYRYYYDGFLPPLLPPNTVGYGPGMPPPMNPMHHTYNYPHNNGGYPASPNWNNGNPPAPNNGGGNNGNGGATVRPKANGGSMSHGNSNSGTNNGTNNGGSSSSVNPPANNNNVAPSNGGSSSGRTGNSNSNVNRPSNNNSNNSGNVSRPNNNSNSSGSNSGRTGNSNSNVSRPSNNNSNSSGNVSRPSNNSNSNRSGNSTSGRSGSNSSNSSSSSSSSSRSGSTGRR